MSGTRDHPPKICPGNAKHITVDAGTAIHQVGSSIEQIKFTRELSLDKRGHNDSVAVPVYAEDLQLAFEHHKEVHIPLAALEDPAAFRDPLLRTIRHHARYHLLCQTRKDFELSCVWIIRGRKLVVGCHVFFS